MPCRRPEPSYRGYVRPTCARSHSGKSMRVARSGISRPSALTPAEGREEDAIRPEDNQSLERSLLVGSGSFGPTLIRQDGAPPRRSALVDEGARPLMLGVSNGPSATAVNLGHDSPPPAKAVDGLDKATRIPATNPAVDRHNPLVYVEGPEPQPIPHLSSETRF